jgi:hypothetical protein
MTMTTAQAHCLLHRIAPRLVLTLALALPGAPWAQTRPADSEAQRGALPPNPSPAEPTPWREGLERSFALPIQQLFNGSAPNQLSLRLGMEAPLNSNAFSRLGSQSQGDVPGSPTLQLGLRYMPLEGWFARVNLLRYTSPSEQRPWNPDFTYAFGFEDWRPYTFSLVYSNDNGNRFHPDRAQGERVTRFDEGTWTLGYKFPLTQAVGCNTTVRYTHRYTDAALGERQIGKKALTAGCRYVLRERWFAALNLYAYPSQRQQQTWDPDYTYSFGWADWRSGGLVVQYLNESGTRYPGRDRAPGTGRFKDGSVSISISWNLNL